MKSIGVPYHSAKNEFEFSLVKLKKDIYTKEQFDSRPKFWSTRVLMLFFLNTLVQYLESCIYRGSSEKVESSNHLEHCIISSDTVYIHSQCLQTLCQVIV